MLAVISSIRALASGYSGDGFSETPFLDSRSIAEASFSKVFDFEF
jgi:hypothetical protein